MVNPDSWLSTGVWADAGFQVPHSQRTIRSGFWQRVVSARLSAVKCGLLAPGRVAASVQAAVSQTRTARFCPASFRGISTASHLPSGDRTELKKKVAPPARSITFFGGSTDQTVTDPWVDRSKLPWTVRTTCRPPFTKIGLFGREERSVPAGNSVRAALRAARSQNQSRVSCGGA